jgi:hypothetical protein
MVSATAPLTRITRVYVRAVYVRAFDLRGGIRALSYKTGHYRFTLWSSRPHRQFTGFGAPGHGASLAQRRTGMLNNGVLMRESVGAQTAAEDAQMEQAEGFLRKLTRREEEILRMRFGIGTEPRQVNEIGKGLGIATATVQRIQWRAVQRLRRLATEDT